MGTPGCKCESNESLRDCIRRFTQRKNQLHHVLETNVINAFIIGINNKDLIHDIGRKGNITAKQMLELANVHADGEDAVNASLGKYKPHPDDKAGPSSPKKKDRKRKGDFVSNAEKGGGGKQKQNNKDKFDKIMNSPCQNHGFRVNHLAKDCAAYRKRLVEEAAKKATKGDNLNNNRPR